MNEERMRELYARSTARRAASDPPCEVSLEAMIDVLEQRGSEAERRQVLADILRSPPCREEFDLLRAVVRASQPLKAPTLISPMWRWAAGIVVVAGLGLAGLLGRRPQEPLRGSGDAIELYAPAEEARVESLPGFVWGALPAALQYRLEVSTDAGAVAFSTTVRDTTVMVPQSTALPPGHYLWLVVAEMPSGQAVRSAVRGLNLDVPK
jgi:hypothetical protein